MKEKIQAGIASGVAVLVLTVLPAFGQVAGPKGDSSRQHPIKKVPEHVILVKGAWSSANDSTPVPESGTITHDVYRNQYFGIAYRLPPDWIQKYAGPPPSDTGSYVLAELSRPDSYKGNGRGDILITAQDMFFTPLPVDTRHSWSTIRKPACSPTTSWNPTPSGCRLVVGPLPASPIGHPWRSCTGTSWPPRSAAIR